MSKKDLSFERHRLEIEDYNPRTYLDSGPSFLATLESPGLGNGMSNGEGYANLLFNKTKGYFHLVFGPFSGSVWTPETALRASIMPT